MDRDCVRELKRFLSADERAKDRKRAQLQAGSRGSSEARQDRARALPAGFRVSIHAHTHAAIDP